MLLVATFYASRPQRNSSRGKNIPLQMANNRQSNYTFGYLVWVCQIGCKPFDLQPISVIIVVEVTGLEPAASASRTQRSTKLSHTSLICFLRSSVSRLPCYYSTKLRKCQGYFLQIAKIIRKHNLPLEIQKEMWYNVTRTQGRATVFCQKHLEIPDYRCAGPVQLSTVNHVRRGTEQH